MIEPQNTLMPIPAQPSPVCPPHGGVTFGEMLAQSLGMIPQLDGAAVESVPTDDRGEQQSDEPGPGSTIDRGRAGGQTTEGSPELFAGVIPTRRFSIPRPVDDGPVTPGPVFVDEPVEPAKPGLPRVPQPPVLGPERPGNGPGAAVVAPEPVALEWTHLPQEGTAAAPEVPQPAVAELDAQQPADGEALEEMTVVAGDDAGPVPAEATSSPQPVPIGSVVDREPGSAAKPAPPVSPRPELAQESGVVGAAAPAANRPETVPVKDAAVVISETRAVPLNDNRVELQPTPAAGRDAAQVQMSADIVSRGAAPVGNFASPAAPVQHTALAERVMKAVELQANQPPPRTMIVDIPEIEGLRLVVSVRGGAEVHVVPTSGSTVSSGLQPFMSELEGVLGERGFVMTGDGRRRGSNEYQRDEEDLPRRSRPTFQQPTDNDLRI